MMFYLFTFMICFLTLVVSANPVALIVGSSERPMVSPIKRSLLPTSATSAPSRILNTLGEVATSAQPVSIVAFSSFLAFICVGGIVYLVKFIRSRLSGPKKVVTWHGLGQKVKLQGEGWNPLGSSMSLPYKERPMGDAVGGSWELLQRQKSEGMDKLEMGMGERDAIILQDLKQDDGEEEEEGVQYVTVSPREVPFAMSSPPISPDSRSFALRQSSSQNELRTHAITPPPFRTRMTAPSPLSPTNPNTVNLAGVPRSPPPTHFKTASSPFVSRFTSTPPPLAKMGLYSPPPTPKPNSRFANTNELLVPLTPPPIPYFPSAPTHRPSIVDLGSRSSTWPPLEERKQRVRVRVGEEQELIVFSDPEDEDEGDTLVDIHNLPSPPKDLIAFDAVPEREPMLMTFEEVNGNVWATRGTLEGRFMDWRTPMVGDAKVHAEKVEEDKDVVLVETDLEDPFSDKMRVQEPINAPLPSLVTGLESPVVSPLQLDAALPVVDQLPLFDEVEVLTPVVREQRVDLIHAEPSQALEASVPSPVVADLSLEDIGDSTLVDDDALTPAKQSPPTSEVPPQRIELSLTLDQPSEEQVDPTPSFICTVHPATSMTEEFPDPDFLPLPLEVPFSPSSYSPSSPSQPSLSLGAVLMLKKTPSFDWSQRASNAPALGMHAEKGLTPKPTPHVSPSSKTTELPPVEDVTHKSTNDVKPTLEAPGLRLRTTSSSSTLSPDSQESQRDKFAYRSPVPEFDMALAMQLRPGLGLGADAAWMVRFLMAMFGWLAVLVTRGPLGRPLLTVEGPAPLRAIASENGEDKIQMEVMPVDDVVDVEEKVETVAVEEEVVEA